MYSKFMIGPEMKNYRRSNKRNCIKNERYCDRFHESRDTTNNFISNETLHIMPKPCKRYG